MGISFVLLLVARSRCSISLLVLVLNVVPVLDMFPIVRLILTLVLVVFPLCISFSRSSWSFSLLVSDFAFGRTLAGREPVQLACFSSMRLNFNRPGERCLFEPGYGIIVFYSFFSFSLFIPFVILALLSPFLPLVVVVVVVVVVV